MYSTVFDDPYDVLRTGLAEEGVGKGGRPAQKGVPMSLATSLPLLLILNHKRPIQDIVGSLTTE